MLPELPVVSSNPSEKENSEMKDAPPGASRAVKKRFSLKDYKAKKQGHGHVHGANCEHGANCTLTFQKADADVKQGMDSAKLEIGVKAVTTDVHLSASHSRTASASCGGCTTKSASTSASTNCGCDSTNATNMSTSEKTDESKATAAETIDDNNEDAMQIA